MIKGHLKKGILTTVALSIITLLCQILSVAYLARNLKPEDFGLIAILVSYFTIISIFTEFSFGSNIIQRKNASQDFISAGIYVVMVLSIIVFIINLLIFKLISEIIDVNSFEVYFFSSFLIVLLPLSNIVDALALNKLDFKKSFIASVLSNVVGVLIVPIYLCYQGYGIYSLLIGTLLAPIIRILVLFKLLTSHLNLSPNFKEFYSGLRFSIYFTLAKFLSMLSLQGDRLVLGIKINNHAVGVYSRAQYFSQAIINLLTVAVERVGFPILSKNSDHEEKKIIFYEMISFIAMVTLSASVALIYMSDTLVSLMLGKGWGEVIPIAQVLALLVFFRSLDKMAAIYMRSDYHIKERFYFQLILSLSILGSIYLFSAYGLLYVAYFIVLLNFVASIYTQFRLSKILNNSILKHLKVYSGAVLSALIFILCLIFLSSFNSQNNQIYKILILIFSYIPVLILIVLKPNIFFRENISKLILKITHRKF
ncbi:oligosaccharide flippase family protein [uncultured Acinetobacter sp.]|uniref:oligosaccharide flippase family protein n=1 Tax=uncultured Acinetobacter sp. TaxID=165433 RepID=UPI00258D6BA0|nr:oligosaccharide flippase family protein [uncultured Acinetobacter sp.]